jgi:outer membrane protein W
LSYNRFWTARVSTRFGAFAATEDLNADGGEKVIGAYHVSAEVHAFRERLFSPYAGLGLALAVNKIVFTGHYASANDTLVAPIVSVGLDTKVTRRFAVGVDVRYLKYDAELGDLFPIDLDPLTVLVSAKFRY